MAEIKIERKKYGWLWIVAGLVVAALLIYFLAFHDSDRDTEAVSEADYISNTNEPAPSGVNGDNGAVASYVNFVENNEENMGRHHDYTNEALLKLIDATNAKANEVGYEVRADIETAREYANKITNEPHETTHADNIRKAADILTNVLQNIQQAEYPGLAADAEELKSASTSIKPGVLVLDQKDAVKNYFEEASDLLQKMN
jgi:hypothetical protein